MLPGIDIEQLILTVGLIGLFAIVFAESGLFFGFFLPGDSLLITAGVLASAEPERFPLALVCIGCFVAAVAGDAVGYWTGSRFGRRLYERPDSRFFRKSHLVAAEDFYRRHGGKTIVVARFVPIVRTFAPIVAGAAGMHYRSFAVYNFTGAAIWALGLPIAGWALGQTIPAEVLDRYLIVILAVVVIVSLLPTIIHLVRANRTAIRSRLPGGRSGTNESDPPSR